MPSFSRILRQFVSSPHAFTVWGYVWAFLSLTGAGLAATTTYNPSGSPHTFVVPGGVTSITFEAWGGGGNGGVSPAGNGASGGGGGAYAARTVSAAPGDRFFITVGTAANDSSVVRETGSVTEVDAKAGANGSNSATVGGLGGSAGSSVGSTTQAGGNGGFSIANAGSGGGGSGGPSAAGNAGGAGSGGATGGAGGTGYAQGGAGGANNVNGNAGSVPGAGGGGGGKGASNGGAGAAGQVIVTYAGTPDITVSGNGVVIIDGDVTPDTADHTDFGSVTAAGAGQITRTFTIVNDGSDTLSLSGPITVSGADFSLSAPPGLTSLAPSSSTTFDVTFAPSTVGTANGSIIFNHNDTDETPFNFNIRGEGLNTAPDLGAPTASYSLNENTTAVTTLSATDPDVPPQSLTYTITGGPDAGFFSLDLNSGALTFNMAPNHEVPLDANGDNIYEIEVTVSDNDVVPAIDVQALSITVLNVIETPNVTGIVPAVGPDAGGTSVTISGANFTGATTVSIGSNPATSVIVVNDTTITAFTAAGMAGPASVNVTCPDGTNAANSAFTFVAPPTITDVSPTSGSTLGGTSVTITGTDFSSATAVSFGGTPATSFTVDSPTQITATTAAHSAGLVSVDVTTIGGTNTPNTLFSYLTANTPPVFTSFSGQAVVTTVILSESNTSSFAVTAIDADVPAQTLTYSLSGPDAALFYVAQDGTVIIRQPLDFEAPADQGANNVYNITVTVTDNGSPNLSDTQEFVITLSNANDTPTLGAIPDQTLPVNGTTGPLAFTVGDTEPSALVTVNTPAGIAGPRKAGTASFGPAVFNLTADVVVANPPQATSALTNAAACAGKIVIVDRGVNNFVIKAGFVQAAGALGMILVNNIPSVPAPNLGGTDPSITIPCMGITQEDGTVLKANVASGLNMTMSTTADPALNLVVTATSNNQTLVPNANIVVGGTLANRTISVTPAAGQSGMAVISYTVSDGVNSFSRQFLVFVGGPAPYAAFTETFEDADGYDVDGWGNAAMFGTPNWVWSTARSSSATHSWYSQSGINYAHRVLVSPQIRVGSNTQLSFKHTYAFEFKPGLPYDGGTLEYSADGMTWNTVPDAAFVAGGFNGIIAEEFHTGNVLKGKHGWVGGTAGALTPVVVDLASFASGQTIRLRWYAGDDLAAAAEGWYVDDVAVTAPEIAVFDGVAPPANERTDNTGTYDFGSVNAGSSSAAQTFTIQNTGTADLTLGTVTLTGTDPTQFSVTQPASTTLTANATTTFTVAFNPTTSGAKSAVVNIASNDGDENPFEINVSGTAAVVLVPTQTSFAFNGADQTFVVPAGVTSINVKMWGGGGAAAGGSGSFVSGDLAVTPNETLTIITGGGGAFSPSSGSTPNAYGGGGKGVGDNGTRFAGGGGGRSAIRRSTTELVTAGAGGGGNQGAAFGGAGGLTSGGNAVNGAIGSGGTQVAGGAKPAGVSSATNGAQFLGGDGQGGSIPGGGGGGSGFYGGGGGGNNDQYGGGGGGSSFTSNLTNFFGQAGLTGSAAGVAPGGATELAYTTPVGRGGPNAAAGGNGLVIITYLASASPEIAVFNGSSTAPGDARTDNAGTHAFGSVSTGSSSAAQTFTIQNTGTADLTLGTVTLGGADAGLFSVTQPVSTTLAANATTTFTVTFSPNSAGAKSAVVNIASNDGDENPFEINVSGTGIDPGEIAVEDYFNADLVDNNPFYRVPFGTTDVGTSITRSFIIKNTGSGTLSIGAITFDDSGFAAYAVINPPPASIPAGGQASFDVKFTALNEGGHRATMHIVNGDLDENPFDIRIGGVGTPYTGGTWTGSPALIEMPPDESFYADGLNFDTELGFVPTPGQEYTFINIQGALPAGVIGHFNDLPDAGVVAMSFNGQIYYFQANYQGGTGGNDLVLRNFNPDTEPMWKWVAGPKSRNGIGVYGEQYEPSETNNPGARQGAMNWLAPNGNLWLFGGYGYGTALTNPPRWLNDLWEYDRTLGQWIWHAGSTTHSVDSTYGDMGTGDPANTPGARHTSGTWTDVRGNLWLYGGFSKGNWQSDLWCYDQRFGEWTWVNGSNTPNAAPVRGTLGVPDAANTPGARSSVTTWFVPDFPDPIDFVPGGKLYLFGGYNGTTHYNDLWSYDISSGEWTWLGGGEVPNQNGVYGTPGVPAPGNIPGSRRDATAFVGRDGNLYLFGGLGYGATGSTRGDLNDLWKFDPTLGQNGLWSFVNGSTETGAQGSYGTLNTPAAGNSPPARSAGSGWATVDGKLWLVGGFKDSYASYNDVWIFDPATGLWTWKQGASDAVWASGVYGEQGVAESGNQPGARFTPSTWVTLNGTLWMFGGGGADAFGNTGRMSDLWSYGIPNPAGAPLDNFTPAPFPDALIVNANPNAYSATAGTTAYVPVSGQLTGADADGDKIFFNSASATTISQGTLTLNANGTWTYTPAFGFTGTAAFQFKASDDYGGQSAVKTLVITVMTNPADSDGDGIADAYERNVWGDLAAADGNGDADFDGQSNYFEFLAGTNPLSGSETLTTAPTVAGTVTANGTIQLQLNHVRPGVNYHLETSSNLDAWSRVGTFTFDVTGSATVEDPTPSTGAPKFYRMSLEATPAVILP